MMRSSFLAVCGLLLLPRLLFGQGAQPPTIVAQPVSLNAFVGQTASVSATVEGTAPLTYQWFKDGVTLAGATNPTFTLLSATLADSAVYYLTATNAAGSITSQPAAIYVSLRPQTITFTPPTAAAASAGVTLSATSSVGLPVTFEIVSGAATLNGNLLTSLGGNVVVRAVQAGTAAIAAAEPVERTITFVVGALSPFITTPPQDQTVNAGTAATFRVTAIGTPAPTYQWQKDGTAIPGATGNTLTLASPVLADAGRYTVSATNFLGAVNAAATLTVRAAPVLTNPPASQAVDAGSPVTLTVEATGFPAPTYQWRRNGTAITGATAATFRIASATAADAGRYEVVVTNVLGTATSPAAVLTVNVRDFAGTYFGEFSSAAAGPISPGTFVLHVRANRTAAFLGHLPGLQAGVAVLDLAVDAGGGFSRAVTVGTQTTTLRGTIDAATGGVSGTVAPTGLTLQGSRAPASGAASAQAGLYPVALVGSSSGQGYVVIAADGQAFVLTAAGTTIDSGRGTVGANGRLAVTTLSGAAVEMGFASGVLSGTVRAGTVTGAIAGALEALTGTEHLVNLSVRSTTQAAAPLITGFVVSGTAPKQLLIRAAGPTLNGPPFNLTGVLANPDLQVFRGSTVIAQNDDWGLPAANGAAVTAAAARTGAFPFRAGSTDAALVTSLPPGPYTVVVGGGNGTTVAEIYEVLEATEVAGARRLVNISARGIVAPAAPLIAGFVVGGTAPKRILVRGIGPGLAGAPFNVAGALPNPQLTIFRGSTPVRTNDDWFRDAEAALIRDAAARAGAFPLGAQSADAAILLYLEPGAYTAQVNGPANANPGIALVEVYESTP